MAQDLINETSKGVDEFTSVLLHFDESVLKDECGNQWTVYHGSPVIDSSIAKFGNSLLLNTGGIYCEQIKSGGFNDYTIDFQLYLKPSDCSDEVRLLFVVLGIQIYYVPSRCQIKINDEFFDISVEQFHHIALVFISENKELLIFIDGRRVGTLFCSYNIAHDIYISTGLESTSEVFGAIDEFRISSIARWSTNFTPPFLAYGDEANLYSKKLHMKGFVNGELVHETVDLFDAPHHDTFQPFLDGNDTVYADVVDVDADFASRIRIKRNNQTFALMKLQTIDAVPELLISEVDYDFTKFNVAYADNPTNLIVSGATSANAAGDYFVDFSPKYGYKWFDGTFETKRREWKINKVSCNASISDNSVSVDNSNNPATVVLNYEGDGEVSVTSCDTSIATVTVASVVEGSDGDTVIFLPQGTSRKIISITGKGVGNCKVIVKVAADNNHFESDEFVINVDAEVYKPLNQCTPAEIKQIVQAGKADKAWNVGDYTADIPLSLQYVQNSNTWYNINGNFKAFILGFNHNNNLEDEGKPSVHFALAFNSSNVPVAFCETFYGKGYSDTYPVYFLHKRSKTASNSNGWNGSYIKSTMLPKFFNALPSDWQAIIQPCTKYTDNTGNASGLESDVSATNDNLWLLSEFEVFGKQLYANIYEQDKQQQYAFFAKDSNNIKFYKHNSTSTVAFYWSRSPVLAHSSATYNKQRFCAYKDETDGWWPAVSTYSRGIVPCFSVC